MLADVNRRTTRPGGDHFLSLQSNWNIKMYCWKMWNVKKPILIKYPLVSALILSTICLLTNLILTTVPRGRCYFPALQMRKLRHMEISLPARDHTAGKQQSWELAQMVGLQGPAFTCLCWAVKNSVAAEEIAQIKYNQVCWKITATLCTWLGACSFSVE